jgi:hypothetical protein
MVGMGSSAQIAVKNKKTTYGANAMSVYDSKRPLTDGTSITSEGYSISSTLPGYVRYLYPDAL